MDPNETKYNIILFTFVLLNLLCQKLRIEFYEHGRGHETGVRVPN